jgi:hypothetical protein
MNDFSSDIAALYRACAVNIASFRALDAAMCGNIDRVTTEFIHLRSPCLPLF